MGREAIATNNIVYRQLSCNVITVVDLLSLHVNRDVKEPGRTSLSCHDITEAARLSCPTAVFIHQKECWWYTALGAN